MSSEVIPPLPITQQGDLVVGNSDGIPVRLPIGADGTFLKSNGTDPVYADFTEADITGLLRGDLLVGNASGIAERLALGAVGDVLYPTQAGDLDWRDAGWVDVRDYGGVADGATNNDTPITNAMAALSALGGGVLFFGPGTWAIGSIVSLTKSNITLKGVGASSTIFKMTANLAGAFQGSYSTTTAQNVTFEDIGFDFNGNNTTNVQWLTFDGGAIKDVKVRRCGFWGFGSVCQAIAIARCQDFYIEDSWFDGDGSAEGTGIAVTGGGRNFHAHNCKFRYLNTGIIASGSGTANADVQRFDNFKVTDCYFDGGWYTLPALYSNSGATVSYSGGTGTIYDGSNVITDSAATFTGLGLSTSTGSESNIRVLIEKESGNVSSWNANRITDSSATFITNGVREGMIVRVKLSGTVVAFGIVSGVESETVMYVEEWLHPTTCRVVTTFNHNVVTNYSYVVYKVGIASTLSATIAGTSITLHSAVRIMDINGGGQLTPSAQTLFEVLPDRPNYCGVHTDYNIFGVTVRGCTVLRSWSDCISVYGNGADICHNYVAWGEDTGITINGAPDVTTAVGELERGHSIVAHNRIFSMGVGAIFFGTGRNLDVVHNHCFGATPWINWVNYAYLGMIYSYDSKGGRLAHNVIDGWSGALTRFGIGAVRPTDLEIENNIIINTTSYAGAVVGPTNSEVCIVDAATRLRVTNQKGLIQHWKDGVTYTGTLTGGLMKGIEYAGSPENVLYAAPGSICLDTTNGYVYVKTSAATNKTGWQAVQSMGYVAKTSTYTATATDQIVACDATSAAFTINLPTAVGIASKAYVIKKIDSSANTVTVDANGTETIDGSLTYALSNQYDTVTIVSDGANWLILSEIL